MRQGDPAVQKTFRGVFESSFSYWQDVYGDRSFLGTVYRERQAGALARIEELRLPAGSPVLESGAA
jgi:hypothetical protein